MKSAITKPFLRLGTCSWKYDSWEGLVYSGYSASGALSQYAQKYPSVEVDQWFWSAFPGKPPKLPAPQTVNQYNGQTPATFRFTVKAPNSITLTHFYKSGSGPLQPNQHFLEPGLLASFLDSLQPLRGKLGPIMFQFEYLNKQKMPSYPVFESLLADFFSAAPTGFTYAVEVRNPNYLTAGYFNFLKSMGILPVFLQGYYMPSVAELLKKHLPLLGNEVVIRLHGPDRQGIEEATGKRWNAIVDDRSAELKQLVAVFKQLLANEISLWVNVNNHFEGSAPLTINRIMEYMEHNS